ncbi:hypothetical protein [Halomonas heilongjiangensis]|nr:hypothetical protein [Halomonas heilongjiangensis]
MDITVTRLDAATPDGTYFRVTITTASITTATVYCLHPPYCGEAQIIDDLLYENFEEVTRAFRAAYSHALDQVPLEARPKLLGMFFQATAGSIALIPSPAP